MQNRRDTSPSTHSTAGPGKWRGRAEEMARQRAAKQPENIKLLSPEETHRLLEELRIQQIEWELQCEDVCQTMKSWGRLLHLSPSFICITGRDGFFKFVNPAMEKLLGYSSQELLSRPILEFIHPEEHGPHDAGVAAQAAGGKTVNFENRYVGQDGSVHNILWAAAPDSEEGVMYCIGRDITEQKLGETLMRESFAEAHRLREALDQVSAYIYMKDTQSRYVYANRMTRELLACSAKELMGSDDFRFFPPDTAKRLREGDRRVFAGEQTAEEIDVVSPESGPRVFWEVKTPIYADPERKTIWGLLGISTDITWRKKAEEAREKLQGQLNQAQKLESIGRLAGGVAHEFNNILQIISCFTYAILEGLPAGQFPRQEICAIDQAVEKAAHLVKQLLAFSHQEPVHMEVLDLNQVISSFVKLLQRLMGEDIELDVLLCPSLPRIQADRARLEQILMNLCVNARDAMPEGGRITLVTEVTMLENSVACSSGCLAKGQYVRLRLADTGQGIAEADLEHIFEPFFTTREIGKGTGLGLATVFGIVHQHKGLIDVQSRIGAGTEFTLLFPAMVETSMTEATTGQGARAAAGNELILLAEDDQAIGEITSQILKKAGYRLMIAHDGEQALELALKHRDAIDLYLFDVVMPKKRGYAVFEEIKRQSPEARFLFVSGFGPEILPREKTLANFEFLPKPYAPQTLLKKIREMLGPTAKAGV